MVLSNKKLKAKLRAALQQAATEGTAQARTVRQDPTKTIILSTEKNGGAIDLQCGFTPTQVEELLRSASKGRSTLSKREKRRKMRQVPSEMPQNGVYAAEEKGKEIENKQDEASAKKKKKKKKEKRKRDETKGRTQMENKVTLMESKGDPIEDEQFEATKNNKRKKKEGEKSVEGVVDGLAPTPEVDIVINAQQNSVPESQESGHDILKVYVGGIPYYSSEDDIRSFFEGCGTVTEVDCMTFPESGKFRGIALISFKASGCGGLAGVTWFWLACVLNSAPCGYSRTQDEHWTEAAAKRALALDGADMGGRYLKIQQYRSSRSLKNNKQVDFEPCKIDNSNRAYIGNLAWDITKDDLKNLFMDCKISSIRFGMDKITGQFKGYGHIDFADDVSLAMALKLDQEVICGRPIKIAYAVPKKGTKEEANSKIKSNVEKRKRRTCYICGEPGHLSSSCSQNQSAELVDSKGGS